MYIIILVFVYLSGFGRFTFQEGDWAKHNAILNDLVNVSDTKSISKEDLINSKLIDVKDIENISFVKVKVILKED